MPSRDNTLHDIVEYYKFSPGERGLVALTSKDGLRLVTNFNSMLDRMEVKLEAYITKREIERGLYELEWVQRGHMTNHDIEARKYTLKEDTK